MKHNLPSSGETQYWTLTITRSQLILATALWLLLFSNGPFWRTVWQGVGGWQHASTLFLISLPVFVLLWLFVLLNMLAWGRLTKLVLGLVLLISAAANYFMSTYGIVIDHSMLTNLLQTDAAEATELLSAKLAIYLLVYAGLPILAISRVQIKTQHWPRELSMKAAGMLIALACLGTITLTQYQAYASLVRNHHELRLLLVPSNVVAAAHSYAKRQRATPATLQRVGTDAHRITPVATQRKPRLLLLVIGETARAKNFSLNGYPRNTNPELAQHDVMSFNQVSSCATATAVSLPCMFLDAGQHNYEDGLALRRESLLDVLQRAGITVLWRDNNSGCKGVCDRIPHQSMDTLNIAELCNQDECYDEILLHGLQSYIDQQKDDTVVVLHMKGSHGPSYSKRYPKAFERFTPVCDSNQLDQCDRQSIINAYDNTLLYTDTVLGQAIDLLKHNDQRFDSSLLYVSDHGESLGEKGIYLHGLPYAMAPHEQTHIPLVLWLSDNLASSAAIDSSCLQQQQARPLSHDNLFHSVLGLMQVYTDAYRAELDLFQSCLQGISPAMQMHQAHQQQTRHANEANRI